MNGTVPPRWLRWLTPPAVLASAALVGAAWIAPSRVVVKLDHVQVRPDVPDGQGGLVGAVARAMSAGLVAETILDVDNQNLLGAQVRSLRFSVGINGRHVGDGRASIGPDGLSIGARSHTRVQTETRFPLALLAMSGADVAALRRLDVDVDGHFEVDVLGLAVERDFHVRGLATSAVALDTVLKSPADGSAVP